MSKQNCTIWKILQYLSFTYQKYTALASAKHGVFFYEQMHVLLTKENTQISSSSVLLNNR